MDGIKATETDHHLMDGRKNREESECEIQRKRMEETRRFEERRTSCDEGWAEPLSWGKEESASSINVPMLLKLMAHSMKEKVLDAGDFQDWKHQVKVKISLNRKELPITWWWLCNSFANTQNIYRDGNESLLLLLLKWCNPVWSTRKVKDRGCWLALGVSLEMQPWVCLNPVTAEQELEA